MRELLKLLTATTGEQALSTPIGKWRLRVSRSLDDIAAIVDEIIVPDLPGIEGAAALITFGSFYSLALEDNTVSLGDPVPFTQDGPANGIVRDGISQGAFILPAIGTYEVSWQVPVDEAGQLALDLNGVLLDETVAGRATGTTSIVNTVVITTTEVDSILRLINPLGNPGVLTITPYAGDVNQAHRSSLWLTVRRLS